MRAVVSKYDVLLPEELLNGLKEKFPSLEVDEKQTIFVPAEELISLVTELKENPDLAFDFLTNLTAVDYPDRFEVVYNFISLQHGYTLMVKVKLSDKENPRIPSLIPLYQGASWQEREVYDLMGIVFTGVSGHPTRILLDENFAGHPLRKDYQWEGGREP